MKKSIFSTTVFSLLLLAAPMQLNAAGLVANPVAADSTTALANTLTNRLDEIALIDKASLPPAERRELRKEVRSINKQLKATNGRGLYVSVGTLLLVIILLILLL